MLPRYQTRTIYFDKHIKPIVLEYKDQTVYSKCRIYKTDNHLNWHEIGIHHNGKLKCYENPKELILDGLFEAIEGSDLYPVAYEESAYVDTFLVRSCKDALDKLFFQGLKLTLRVPKNATLDITVQFNVGVYRSGQISPIMLISAALNRLMDSLEDHDGESGILNLRNFSSHYNFEHVVVSLSNLATFRYVCEAIYRNDDRYRAVNGIILAHNKIRTLEAFTVFPQINWTLLDLSNNRIHSASRLCRDLKHVRAAKLKLENNSVTKSNHYPKCLKPLEKNFRLVDGVPFDKLHRNYTPLNNEIDMRCDGTRIDWSNKALLQQFAHSPDWHAFLIPDAEREMSKESVFDYLFISVNPNLCEFYPCYYRFEEGEHRFIVRNCFEQIEHLVNFCNLELKIPQLVAAEHAPIVSLDRSIPYYLRMNASRYVQHHVDPVAVITKAIANRFVPPNRLLNLDRFQQAEGLENVIVNMRMPKILERILSIAAGRYTGLCQELRLCHNKIMSITSARRLLLLGTLQAVDLSYNWLHDLDDIKLLGDVPLKSLLLHGNPLCSKYSLPSDYVKAVCAHFPHLTKLDGVDLKTKPGPSQSLQKDFLCNTAGYELAELFLNTYLREFEAVEQRVDLEKFYTDQSMFTMTCTYDTKHISPQLCRRMASYISPSRNLFKIPDYANAVNSIHVGFAEIRHVFMQLPSVRHDFVSLQTDTMHYDDKSAVIYVTGLLCEDRPSSAHQQHEELYLAFSRQFILKVDADNLGIGGQARRYKITNERFNIMSPTANQKKNAFKIDTGSSSSAEQQTEPLSVDVKEHMLLIFQEITGLRSVWCTRCLEEAEWNYEIALQQFLESEESNQLPDNAFI